MRAAVLAAIPPVILPFVTGAAVAFEVHAGGLLEAQYGVADALEHVGFRFRSPFETYYPPTLRPRGVEAAHPGHPRLRPHPRRPHRDRRPALRPVEPAAGLRSVARPRRRGLARAVAGAAAPAHHRRAAVRRLRSELRRAGRDQSFELGRNLGIVSQPDRVTFDDLVTADAATVDRVRTDVDALAAFADRVDAIADDLDALALPRTRRTRELRDGARVTALRTRFAVENYRTMLAHLAGDPAARDAHHAVAVGLVDEGAAVVRRRHADLHTGRPSLVTWRLA